MGAFEKIRMAARDLAAEASDCANQEVVRQRFKELMQAIDDAAGGSQPIDVRTLRGRVALVGLSCLPARKALGNLRTCAYRNASDSQQHLVDVWTDCLHDALNNREDLLCEKAQAEEPAPEKTADLGQFELSAYNVGITRHEVAAAALDRIMARDYDSWGCLAVTAEPRASHPRRAALEAWAYANSLFEVEHTTEEQPS